MRNLAAAILILASVGLIAASAHSLGYQRGYADAEADARERGSTAMDKMRDLGFCAWPAAFYRAANCTERHIRDGLERGRVLGGRDG